MAEPAAGLHEAVHRFIDELAPVVEQAGHTVRGVRHDRLRGDVVLEAYNLTAAFIDADSLHTDEELWAFIATFGPMYSTQLGAATPGDVRRADLVTARRRTLDGPSALFDVLVGLDRRDGTAFAWRYFELALAIGHQVAAIDRLTSRTELEAIERFRSMLLATMKHAGVDPRSRSGGLGRPGTPGAGAGPQAPGPASTQGGDPATGTEPTAGEEPAPARSLEEVLAELHGLIGLDAVKAEVELVADLLYVQRLREERGLPVASQTRHLVFTGNPGTGKTTVARLLAEIYRALGAVPTGQLVETDRSGLVAGFVGQTAVRTKEVFDRAIGGVLLIDEAYALARGDQRDFGQEAIDTLVKLMEDHRRDTAVIVAGYPEEMHHFVESNPGLRSRFPKTVHFPDYTDDELVAIFRSMCEKHAYRPTPEALDAARELFAAQARDKGFGNARLARNLFEASVARQASRVRDLTDPPTDEQLATLDRADLGV